MTNFKGRVELPPSNPPWTEAGQNEYLFASYLSSTVRKNIQFPQRLSWDEAVSRQGVYEGGVYPSPALSPFR